MSKPALRELDRLRRIVRCAQLYYGLVPGLDGELRQSDVARRMGVPRSQVVLWLQEARERFLEIRLRAPRAVELELPLEERLRPFGIREVRIAVDGGLTEEGAIDAAGAEAARCLREILVPGMRLGLAGGRTVRSAVRELLRGPALPRLELFPLAAGGSLPVSANALVAMLAGAAAEGTAAAGLWVPPLKSGQGRRDLKEFLSRPEVREVFRAAQDVDAALIGVGAVGGEAGTRAMMEYLGAPEEAARRMEAGPARGFVLQQFIDGQGADHPCALGERNLAVPLDVMRRMTEAHPRRRVILIASSPSKARAAAAAVRGRLASVLVIDTSLAEALIEEFPA